MANKGRTPHGLPALATRQHGVVSARQLYALGFSRELVMKEAARGHLLPLHQGVYAVGHKRLTWHSRCWAAVLAVEPNETDDVVVWPAVASHGSAAYLWGVLSYPPETIDVTAPVRRRAKREFRVHFSSILTAEDRGECEGLPVTSVPRTLLDLAASPSRRRLDRYLERAEELKLLDLIEVESVLARAGGHRGRGRLRRALGIYEPDPAFTRSGLETRFLDLVRGAGLPIPATNYVVEGLELDSYWEPERFAVELDVYETHGSRAAFERDRRREDDLLELSIESIRVTGPRLKQEPSAIVERVARHLSRRRRELG